MTTVATNSIRYVSMTMTSKNFLIHTSVDIQNINMHIIHIFLHLLRILRTTTIEINMYNIAQFIGKKYARRLATDSYHIIWNQICISSIILDAYSSLISKLNFGTIITSVGNAIVFFANVGNTNVPVL